MPTTIDEYVHVAIRVVIVVAGVARKAAWVVVVLVVVVAANNNNNANTRCDDRNHRAVWIPTQAIDTPKKRSTDCLYVLLLMRNYDMEAPRMLRPWSFYGTARSLAILSISLGGV